MVASEKAMRRILACEKRRSKSLDLTRLNLEELPERVTTFTWLKSLHLGGNSLVKLPPAIGNLKAIEVLELNGNPIIELPDSFGNLEELRVFWCAGTKLTRLPAGFTRLTKLTDLHISDQFSEVPVELSAIKSLRRLWLGANPITTIPAWLGELASLEYLSFWGDPVTSVPPELGRLANLRTFDVRETKLKPPFPNFTNGRTEIVTESMPTPPAL
jgi:Leucine-rich repeat (LRR) protein